jgi:hypothetical protein
VLVFLGLAGVYLANARLPIDSADTLEMELLPLAIVRGDGPFLDRFAAEPAPLGASFSSNVERSRGHAVSRYPVAPSLLFAVLEAPQVWARDWIVPGWDRTAAAVWYHCKRMAKISAVFVAAAAGAGLYRLLGRLGFGRVALPSVVAAALGSDLWVAASQALWQHGPAALALVVSALLLVPRGTMTRARLALAGTTTALMVAFRSVDVVLAVVLLLWVARHHTRRLAWFLPGPVLIGSALIGYNLWFFGSVAGGQAALEELHPEVHGVSGVWTGELAGGAAGTLLSPSRGLFVYCPWAALAVAALPWSWRRLRDKPLAPWLVAALAPYLLLLSKYSVWWGGHSFGPRYWTDVMPIFALLLAAGLDGARGRYFPLRFVFGATVAFAVAVQAVGAFCYPSTWNQQPADVDRHHERLWDWVDNEITRCILEGVKEL